MENKIQLSKDEIIMGFVASCIEDVADTLDLDYLEVYRRMDAVKMIEELFSRIMRFCIQRVARI